MAPSFDVESAAPQVHSASTKQAKVHPFAPLSGDEMVNAGTLLRKSWPAGTDLQFRVITLREPVKKEMIRFLDAEAKDETVSTLPARKAFCLYYIRRTSQLHEAVVDLSEQKVEYNVRLGPNVHANIDGPTIIGIEQTALEDEAVKAEIKKLELPEGSVVVCDPW